MRIDRLDLIAYGPFTGKSLDLAAGESGLHLIYGDNEAGKSTSLKALTGLLFGIETRTYDNFLHSNPQLRIGGRLKLSDGKEVEFVRRKGAKGTLLKYGTDEPLDDKILAPFLPGGIDENIFKKLWGINHDRLIKGGKELLNQSGDLGQALFSAAVGTADFRKILADMQSSAEEIFKPRASKAALNQSISDFKDAQKRIKDTSLPVSNWKKLQKDLSDKVAAIDQIEKDIELNSRKKSRLDRVNRVKGVLAERRNVLEKIIELGEVSLLPEDFEKKRMSASDNLQAAGGKKKRLEAKLASLTEESESLNIRNDLLENEETILDLYRELGAVEKILKDQPQQNGKRRLLRNEAETLLKSVRLDVELDQADDLRPLLNKKKWIWDLAHERRLLTQKKEQAEASLKDIKDKQESLRNDFNDKPQSKLDLKELKAVIAEVRRAGDAEQRLSEAQRRAAEEKESCVNELARLGKFSGTVESLLKLAMPLPETLDKFEKENDERSENLKETARKLHETEEEKKQTEQELKALLLTSDAPTIAELEESRDVRNKGWSLIKRKYIEQIDIEKELSEYAPGSGLVSKYEQKADYADQVSDRLRSAAGQVEKRAALEAKAENLQSRIDGLAGAVERVKDGQNACHKRWSAIWEPLGISAGTPREMKQWFLRVENLVEKVQAANAVSADEQNLAEKCGRLKEAASSQIAEFDGSADRQGMSLEAMVSLCEQRAEEEEGVRGRRRQLEQSLNKAEIRLKRIFDELKSVETEQSNWLRQWGQAIEGLGLKTDVHPEHATETFDQMVSFFGKFDKSEELRKRIYGMDQEAENFEKNVFDFADGIGLKRNGQEAATIASRLNRDLNAAREARASLTKIQIQLREIKEEKEDADITIRNSEEQLAALREQAGANADEELMAAGERSANKRELQKKLDMLEQELNRTGDGLSIEELEKESEELEIDSVEGELEKFSAELKELQINRDDLRDQRQTLQNEIEAKDGSAMAANASEEAEEHLAGMVSNAEKYLRLQIAALILEQRIEDYRKKNQAPLLSRAGELFSRLTLGSYAGLRDELDGHSKPVLLGVRPDDKEVAVKGMSDGSRDQLYLALCLATLEQHLGRGEPMPFVVDDILIGFDDNRARVCLEILTELSASVQVLLFTHHRRVLELAEAIDAKDGILFHELS